MSVAWISVEERLPEVGKPVLVWCGTKSCGVARRRDIARMTDVSWSSIPGGWSVFPTHWAELPEGPRQ